MVISKDGVSRATLAALLDFSTQPECQFLVRVKPDTQIVNDHRYQQGSVISFWELKEDTHVTIGADGVKSYGRAFSLKICVEDRYWVKAKNANTESENDRDSLYLAGIVPPSVHQRILEILYTE